MPSNGQGKRPQKNRPRGFPRDHSIEETEALLLECSYAYARIRRLQQRLGFIISDPNDAAQQPFEDHAHAFVSELEAAAHLIRRIVLAVEHHAEIRAVRYRDLIQRMDELMQQGVAPSWQLDGNPAALRIVHLDQGDAS